MGAKGTRILARPNPAQMPLQKMLTAAYCETPDQRMANRQQGFPAYTSAAGLIPRRERLDHVPLWH